MIECAKSLLNRNIEYKEIEIYFKQLWTTSRYLTQFYYNSNNHLVLIIIIRAIIILVELS
jgi:hypothetical protein